MLQPADCPASCGSADPAPATGREALRQSRDDVPDLCKRRPRCVGPHIDGRRIAGSVSQRDPASSPLRSFRQGHDSHQSIDAASWTRDGVPVLTADACGFGMGGWFEQESYTGLYRYPDTIPSIAYGELLALLLLLRRVGPSLVPGPDGDGRVLLRSDNT